MASHSHTHTHYANLPEYFTCKCEALVAFKGRLTKAPHKGSPNKFLRFKPVPKIKENKKHKQAKKHVATHTLTRRINLKFPVLQNNMK